MKPTNEELEAMGFNPYADKQKADTLSKIPKVNLEIEKFVNKTIEPAEKKVKVIHFPDLPTNPLEEFVNDALADGFTFQNGTLTKHTHVEEPIAPHFQDKYLMETDEYGKVKIKPITQKYDFLQDISDAIDVLIKAGLEPGDIQNVAEQILEKGLRKICREVTK